VDHDYVDSGSGELLNDYLYLVGDDPAELQRSGAVTVQVKEKGPLVASLLITSEAPGCHRLEREIRLVAGLDSVEISNLVDKRRLVAGSYHAKDGKESVNFAFPFVVPGGQVRVQVPFGVVRPDVDQMPSACKNWFTMDRWADVSNGESGITWVSMDAPLVQVGGVTATLLNSQTNPDAWRSHVGSTQKLVSWVMNNHWGTNYRAYQEGPVMFRYLLWPHGPYDPVEANRLAVGFSQPLLTVRARGVAPERRSLFRVEPDALIVTGFKSADDGDGYVLRLWNTGAEAVTAHLGWRGGGEVRVMRSDTSEVGVEAVGDRLEVSAGGLVTLRVEEPSRHGGGQD
jgi:alpha-mannosidase